MANTPDSHKVFNNGNLVKINRHELEVVYGRVVGHINTNYIHSYIIKLDKPYPGYCDSNGNPWECTVALELHISRLTPAEELIYRVDNES